MKNIFYAFIITIFIVSCNKSFLDVSNELADEMDMEKIFSNPVDTRRFHRYIYNGIPNTMNITWWSNFTSFKGQSNIWANFSDDLCKAAMNAFPYSRAVDPTDDFISRWHYYKYIRQANIFLERAKEIPKTGMADFIGLTELNDLKAQARFFRAYYHYLLFEIYGPIPIMANSIAINEEVIDFPRSSVDEVVDFIYNELTAVSNELKDPNLIDVNQLAVPTKGTALAVRARLLMYAASPLFNGGYTEGLDLTNKDGKKLFPEFESRKWDRALAAIQEFIDYANSGHYELFKVIENGVINPHKSIYEVHMSFNKETIFARSEDNTNSTAFWLDQKNVPRGARGGNSINGGVAVTQELVDAFEMVDGFSIKQSPLYSEIGFSVAGEDLSGQTEVGTYKMFINREPRFYQTVFYNGRKWHVGNEQIWFQNETGNSGKTTNGQAAQRYVRTGHLLYKRMSRRVYAEGSHPRTEYRPPIVHRLAEFYLLYAEALNEVDPADPRIIEYVDKVRDRAGVPLIKDVKVNIIGSQQLQREAIRHEMRVELASEGQRFFDQRRWMIAHKSPSEGGLNGSFYGMNMDASDLNEFYKRTKLHDRVFHRKEYLAPLPLNEIQKSQVLVQNPNY